jgi:hypothetical protein
MNQEHKKIAHWAGLECRCEPEKKDKSIKHLYWVNCPRHSNGGNPPDYDQNEVAISLLPLLSQKTEGVVSLQVFPNGDAIVIHSGVIPDVSAIKNSISAAIKTAVLELIATA